MFSFVAPRLLNIAARWMQKSPAPRCIQVIFRNSQAAIFTLSIASFKILSSPSFLCKPEAQEISLVEQFGLELCQSVT